MTQNSETFEKLLSFNYIVLLIIKILFVLKGQTSQDRMAPINRPMKSAKAVASVAHAPIVSEAKQ